MAGSVQRALPRLEGTCPIVQSEKQQKFEGPRNAERKAQQQAEAVQRLAMRRITEGSAGGFFDRQDANDRNQWNSDDEEFDDFGRRKRKKTGSAAPVKKKKEAEAPSAASSAAAQPGPSPEPVVTDPDRVEGTVRWYESSKGFGFVRTPGIDADIYFKDMDRSLAPVVGMRVTFVVKMTADGKPQARDLMPGNIAASSRQPPRPAALAKPPAAEYDEVMQWQMMQQMQSMQSAMQNWSGAESSADYGAVQNWSGAESSADHGAMENWSGAEWSAEAALRGAGFSPAALRADFEKAAQTFERTIQSNPFLSEPSSKPAKAQPVADNGYIGQLIGKVKSYNPMKGFGFISSNAVSGDVYFKGRFDQIVGRTVSFRAVSRGSNSQAFGVEIID